MKNLKLKSKIKKLFKKFKRKTITNIKSKYFLIPKPKQTLHNIKNKKLFKQSLLYSEGKEKPLLRGYIHLFYTFFLPLLYYQFIYKKKEYNNYHIITFSFISIFLCKLISSLYHCIKWSSQKEIILQKLDYCFISFMICGIHFPFINYFLSPPFTFFFYFINIILCISSFLSVLVFAKVPFLIYIIHSVILLPFITLFAKKINIKFTIYYLLSLILYGIGFYIFKKQKNISFYPKIYGHHEVFHLLTIISNIIFIILLYHFLKK